MRKQRFLFAAAPLLALALTLALIFTACPPEEGTGQKETKPLSAMPVISLHPTSADYLTGETVKELKVQAKVNDGGTITYQWYETATYTNTGGTAVANATGPAFTPDMAGKTESFFYAAVTNTTGDYDPQKAASNPARIKILDAAAPAPTVTVTIADSSKNAQYVRGFGGMSNAFSINPADVAQYMEVKDIDTMFNPDTGLGYNILRIMIWPDPLDNVLSGQVQPQMNNQLTYLKVVQKVNEYGGYVLASPWTPPLEFKSNQSATATGNTYLLPRHYVDYAEYLANYASQMAKKGAPLYSVSIQNEPTIASSYDGCTWTEQQQVDFFTNAGVGKFLEGVKGFGGGKSLDSVLVMSGEPHQNVKFNDRTKNNATANSIVDIYAYHIYGSMEGPYRDVQADTDKGRKEVWMTEHNINSGGGLEAQDYSWNYVWSVAEEIDHIIRVNDTNAFVWWYLKRYYSMIGENAYGTVNGEVLPRGWVMSHWAKYATDTVRAPAVVTGHEDLGNGSDASSTGKTSTVMVKASAFRKKSNPSTYVENQVKKAEDSISLVIFNQKTSGGHAADIKVVLPADFDAASNVSGIISDSTGKRHAPHLVVLAGDGKSAVFNLPSNSIVSLKFTK